MGLPVESEGLVQGACDVQTSVPVIRISDALREEAELAEKEAASSPRQRTHRTGEELFLPYGFMIRRSPRQHEWLWYGAFLTDGRACSSVDRASASGAEGHRFKSCQAHHNRSNITDVGSALENRQDLLDTQPGGPLAQLVEQLTLNQRAVGSTPTRPTKNIQHLAPAILVIHYSM